MLLSGSEPPAWVTMELYVSTNKMFFRFMRCCGQNFGRKFGVLANSAWTPHPRCCCLEDEADSFSKWRDWLHASCPPSPPITPSFNHIRSLHICYVPPTLRQKKKKKQHYAGWGWGEGPMLPQTADWWKEASLRASWSLIGEERI